jgi:hypothetical protein
MSTTLTKKSREGSARKPFFKPAPATNTPKDRISNATSTFEQAYSQLLHRRDNDFCTLDSPNLTQQLHHLPTPDRDDPYRSALSTPPARTIIALERKKYLHLKQHIDQTVH